MRMEVTKIWSSSLHPFFLHVSWQCLTNKRLPTTFKSGNFPLAKTKLECSTPTSQLEVVRIHSVTLRTVRIL